MKLTELKTKTYKSYNDWMRAAEKLGTIDGNRDESIVMVDGVVVAAWHDKSGWVTS